MITGGTLQKERLILTTESVADAKLVKSGIGGRNNFINIAPYGNHLSLKIEGQNLSVTKEDKRVFTFEEVHALLKKIQMFGRIKKRVMHDLLESSRHTLCSKLTLFFPNDKAPMVELAFAYNWAAMEFESEFFGKILPEVKQAVKKSKAPSIKIFSNNMDIISFHNYAMNGIYINRRAFEGIADVLCENRLLGKPSRPSFVMRACAFGVKSVAYMETRKIYKITDDLFELNQVKASSPEMGDIGYFVPLMEVFDVLAKTGKLSALSGVQLASFRSISDDVDSLDQYNLPETIVHSVVGFIDDFREEIQSFSEQAA
jgi:hypothetical protein